MEKRSKYLLPSTIGVIIGVRREISDFALIFFAFFVLFAIIKIAV